MAVIATIWFVLFAAKVAVAVVKVTRHRNASFPHMVASEAKMSLALSSGYPTRDEYETEPQPSVAGLEQEQFKLFPTTNPLRHALARGHDWN